MTSYRVGGGDGGEVYTTVAGCAQPAKSKVQRTDKQNASCSVIMTTPFEVPAIRIPRACRLCVTSPEHHAKLGESCRGHPSAA